MSEPVEAILVVLGGIAFGFLVITVAVYGLVAMVEAASKSAKKEGNNE